MSIESPLRVLALVPELLTNVRIESGVQRLGGFAQIVDTPRDFVAELATRPDLAVIDLSLDWIDLGELVAACLQARVPLLAFGPHVDTGKLRQARAAGVDFVFTRSQFLTDVSGTLREAVAGARA